MLQAIREKAQGWIAWVIVVLIALTFILFWGSGSFFSGGGSEGPVLATVNGEKITAQELDSKYEKVIQQQDRSLAQLEPELVKKQLLDNLIREKVLIQTADHLGFTVNPQRIELFITHSPMFLQDGRFSKDLYMRFLYNMGISDKEFRALLSAQLMQQQLYAGLVNTSFIIEPEVDAFLKFYTQKRSFKYTTVERAPIAKSITISDEELQAYYEGNPKQFYTQDQVSIDYVRLNLDAIKQKLEVSEEQLQSFYQENTYLFNDPERRLMAHILIQTSSTADEEDAEAVQQKISDITKALGSGKSFESLAKEYSDDQQTKDEGGKLDWIVKGELGIESLEKAVFSLRKGEVSEPVKTEYGYHFVKLLDIEAEKRHSFEAVKDKVANTLKERLAEDELIALADRMANYAYDHPESLDTIVDELSLPLLSTKLFDKSAGPEQDALKHPEVIKAAFSDYVRLDGNNSDLIEIDDKDYVVLRVKQSVPSTLKPFEAVKSDINAMMVFERSNIQAKEKAQTILQAVKDNQAEIVNKITWQEKKEQSRNEASLDHFLLMRAFELPRSSEDGSAILDTVQLENNDYAVLWLTEIIDGTEADLKEVDKSQIKDHLVRQFGELEFTLFSTNKYDHAKIANSYSNEKEDS